VDPPVSVLFVAASSIEAIEHSSSLSTSPSLLSHLFVCAAGAIKMAFSRSVASLYRTSRALNARGANPVNRVFGHERFGARAYAAAFQRDKPHVNIGMFRSTSLDFHTSVLMVMQAQLATSITARPPSQQRSPSDKQKRVTRSILIMALLTRRLKRGSEVSRSPLPTSNTIPMLATTPTSIAPVTPIT
jgi:hypothetical protein